MQKQFLVNVIGPAMIIKNFSKFLPKHSKSIFFTLSARVGSISDNNLGGWMSYRASKAALNQIVRSASIELAARYPSAICVAIHPGTVRSKLTQRYLSRYKSMEPEESARKIITCLGGLSLSDSGKFFDYNGKLIEW